MTTIPQVARTMREILTTNAEDAARTTRFVQRQSPLGGATFSQTLVFGFLGQPQASLEELAHTAATLGVHLTPHALDQRFTPAAATCLEPVFRGAIRRVIAADPVAMPLLDRFTAVSLHDSSTIVLPDLFATVWRGCGGSTTARTSAALKLQVRVALRTGRLEDCQRQDGRTPDQRAAFPAGLPAGALRLADLGYWSLEAVQTMAHHGAFWLARLQTQTAVYGATGQRQDLLALLDAQPTESRGARSRVGCGSAGAGTAVGSPRPPSSGRGPPPPAARDGAGQGPPGQRHAAGVGGVDARRDQCASGPLDLG